MAATKSWLWATWGLRFDESRIGGNPDTAKRIASIVEYLNGNERFRGVYRWGGKLGLKEGVSICDLYRDAIPNDLWADDKTGPLLNYGCNIEDRVRIFGLIYQGEAQVHLALRADEANGSKTLSHAVNSYLPKVRHAIHQAILGETKPTRAVKSIPILRRFFSWPALSGDLKVIDVAPSRKHLISGSISRFPAMSWTAVATVGAGAIVDFANWQLPDKPGGWFSHEFFLRFAPLGGALLMPLIMNVVAMYDVIRGRIAWRVAKIIQE